MKILKDIFYFEYSYQIKQEIKQSILYFFKYNSLIIFLAVILIALIDKNSYPDWIYIIQKSGLVYFYPQLLFPAKLIFITLNMIPLLIFFVTIIYIILILEYYNTKYFLVIKHTYLRYCLSWTLLFLFKNSALLFVNM